MLATDPNSDPALMDTVKLAEGGAQAVKRANSRGEFGLMRGIWEQYRGSWAPSRDDLLPLPRPTMNVEALSYELKMDLLEDAPSGVVSDWKRRNDYLGGCIFEAITTAKEHHRYFGFYPWERRSPAEDDPQQGQSFSDIDHLADSQLKPTLMPRVDDQCLLYPGLTHSFFGHSNSGKSLIVQHEAVRVAQSGGRVLYLDYEASRAQVGGRLQKLGLTSEHGGNVVYYKGLSPASPAFKECLSQEWTLVVIDGVTAALAASVQGETPSNNNDAITRWHAELPDPLAATGAAVVMVDHVVKNQEGGATHAIGGQAKRAALTGAAYYVEQTEPFAIGRDGVASVRLAGKDREGMVMAALGGAPQEGGLQVVTEVQVHSQPDGCMSLTLAVPASAAVRQEAHRARLARQIWDYVHQSAEPVKAGDIKAMLPGRKDKADAPGVCEELVDKGYLQVESGARNAKLYRTGRDLRAGEDFEAPLEDLA